MGSKFKTKSCKDAESMLLQGVRGDRNLCSLHARLLARYCTSTMLVMAEAVIPQLEIRIRMLLSAHVS